MDIEDKIETQLAMECLSAAIAHLEHVKEEVPEINMAHSYLHMARNQLTAQGMCIDAIVCPKCGKKPFEDGSLNGMPVPEQLRLLRLHSSECEGVDANGVPWSKGQQR